MDSEQQYVNLYFQIHQPCRLRKFQFFDVGASQEYFDHALNRDIMTRIAKQCYLPANRLLLEMIEKHPEVKVTFSISGTALEQFERYAPRVLHSFRRLAETGSVEFLGETYYHSLAYFIDNDEFIEQIRLHRQKINDVIGVRPSFFRNTELIYSDAIGSTVADLGFSGMYIDGVNRVLNGKTPNALYRHPDRELVLIPRNYQLSDDVAFRYSDRHWSEWPLTGKKFATWISSLPHTERIVNLAMDYETFGEHKKAESGIFDFLREFIVSLSGEKKFRFINPSEASRLIQTGGALLCERAISWADEERDLSAWLGNDMQRDAFDSLYRFHNFIVESGSRTLLDTYRHLQTSDHFYYMATKKDADGAVHQYFSPYNSPYEAFMNFMNIVSDLELRVKNEAQRSALAAKNMPARAVFASRRS